VTPPALEIADLIRTAGAAPPVDPLEACQSAAGDCTVSYGCARRASR
jgi:hypothetical protein